MNNSTEKFGMICDDRMQPVAVQSSEPEAQSTHSTTFKSVSAASRLLNEYGERRGVANKRIFIRYPSALCQLVACRHPLADLPRLRMCPLSAVAAAGRSGHCRCTDCGRENEGGNAEGRRREISSTRHED